MKRVLPVWTPAQIRALRLHCGLSQVELADYLQIRQATISEWESGIKRPIRSMRLLLLNLAEYARYPLE